MNFLKHNLVRFFSIKLWGSLPGWMQRELSSLYAGIYNKPFTKHSYVVAIDLECRPCQFVKLNGKSIFDGGKSDCPNQISS